MTSFVLKIEWNAPSLTQNSSLARNKRFSTGVAYCIGAFCGGRRTVLRVGGYERKDACRGPCLCEDNSRGGTEASVKIARDVRKKMFGKGIMWPLWIEKIGLERSEQKKKGGRGRGNRRRRRK